MRSYLQCNEGEGCRGKPQANGASGDGEKPQVENDISVALGRLGDAIQALQSRAGLPGLQHGRYHICKTSNT